VLEEAQIDLDMARLVPDLACHVHRELPRRVREVADRPTRALHRLYLAHEDPMDPLPDRVGAGEIGERREALRDLQLRHLASAHPHPPVFPRELVVGDRALHRNSPSEK